MATLQESHLGVHFSNGSPFVEWYVLGRDTPLQTLLKQRIVQSYAQKPEKFFFLTIKHFIELNLLPSSLPPISLKATSSHMRKSRFSVQWVELELTVIIWAPGELEFETLTIWGQQVLGTRWKLHVDLIILVAEHSIKM